MPDITPLPTGALDVGEWCLDGATARRFWGTGRFVKTQYGDDVYLELGGDQYRDGRIDRHVRLNADNGDVLLNADEARQVAAQLLVAADEMGDPMNEPTVSVKVVADNTAKPVTLVFTGNRGMCSCGWIGKPRWTAYGARIDAHIHAEETGHDMHSPVVWES